MKASELRIGNKLLFIDYPVQGVRSITGADIGYAEKEPNWLNAFFKPIELTEKWLLKVGFAKHDEAFDLYYIKYICPDVNAIYSGDEMILTIDIDTKIGCISNKSGESCIPSFTGTYIKYVHQLQNLYFSLTYKELTEK